MVYRVYCKYKTVDIPVFRGTPPSTVMVLFLHMVSLSSCSNSSISSMAVVLSADVVWSVIVVCSVETVVGITDVVSSSAGRTRKIARTLLLLELKTNHKEENLNTCLTMRIQYSL